MRAVVDQMTNCEDIFLNAMVADDVGAVGIMADRWMEYSCAEGCGKTPDNSISMAEGHYEERSRVRGHSNTTSALGGGGRGSPNCDESTDKFHESDSEILRTSYLDNPYGC